MTDQFFKQPILNLPYDYPALHWELDEDGQPTNNQIESRRPSKFLTPIPKPKKRRKAKDDVQQALPLFDTEDISDESQTYDLSLFINSIREKVNAWRQLSNPADWKVTPETVRLLQHWRSHKFQNLRPFFCQLEAAETAIWLAEVAPRGRSFLAHIASVNEEANPELMRVALKLGDGSG